MNYVGVSIDHVAVTACTRATRTLSRAEPKLIPHFQFNQCAQDLMPQAKASVLAMTVE